MYSILLSGLYCKLIPLLYHANVNASSGVMEYSDGQLVMSQYPVVAAVCLELAGRNQALGILLRLCKGTAQYHREIRLWRTVSKSKRDVAPSTDPRLADAYAIDLSYRPIRDVSALGHVHILDLSFTWVVDVSALGHVHTLDLSYTEVVDVSALGNVHTLHLRGTKVTDVSALGGVHILDLSWTTVVDVSMLAGVHILNLQDAWNADYAALRRAQRLLRSDDKK